MNAQHQLPAPEAVEQAISALLGSFPGLRVHPEGSETNAGADTLKREIAALELSASAIHHDHELLLRVARLKRHLNSSQWIYQLPEEVFADILVIDVLNFGFKEVEHPYIIGCGPWGSSPRPRIATPAARRAQLCNVSHRFLQTVMTTPRIWSDIRWGRDDYLRLLKMSAQAPLRIQCRQWESTIVKEPGTINEFLKAVWEHSERWKALTLDLQLDASSLPPAEFPAPQLRDLDITNRRWPRSDPTPYILRISGNPSLRNLALTETSLQWDGINFSRLKSLSLSNIQQGAPSLENLVETLMMASCLESLSLRQVNIVYLDKMPQLGSQPIHLHSLTNLLIDEMPSGSVDYLITRIRSPQLKMSHVHGLLLKHFENSGSDQNPYHHFFRVIIPTLAAQRNRTLALCNDISSKVVYLSPAFTQLHQPGFAPVESARFGVETENPVRGVQAMVDFLTSYRIDGPLVVMASGHQLLPPSSESCFPAEVLGKLPMVTKISAGVLVDTVNILNFLGSLRRDEGTGRFGWACPQLEVLAVEGTQGLTPDHIQAFLDARYGDGNPLIVEGQVVQRPQRVRIQHHGLIMVGAPVVVPGPMIPGQPVQFIPEVILPQTVIPPPPSTVIIPLQPVAPSPLEGEPDVLPIF